MRQEVEALGDLNEPPKYEVVERPDATPNLKPIFYSGFDYQGKPTTVFAWLGVPEKSEGKKVPAVVLAHGGGGAASKDWVKNWNKHGYAAISMSLEGQTEYDPALKGYGCSWGRITTSPGIGIEPRYGKWPPRPRYPKPRTRPSQHSSPQPIAAHL